MSKLEQIEARVKELSAAEQQQLRDWLEDLLEDRMVVREEFQTEIKQAEAQIRAGEGRTRKP